MGNQLDHLTQYQFNQLSKLEELNLNKNRISSIDSKAFVGLKSLKKILLDLNKLSKTFDKGDYEELDALTGLQVVFKAPQY